MRAYGAATARGMHGGSGEDQEVVVGTVPAIRPLSVGPVLLTRLRGSWRYEPAAHAAGDGRALLAICMVLHGRARWRDGDRTRSCQAGDVLLIDRTDDLAIAGENGLDVIVLLLPHHYLLPVLGALPASGAYRASGSFGAMRDLCERVLDAAGTTGRDDLLAAALRHCAAAALAGIGRADTLRVRRDGELLERCLAAIDGHPAEPLSSDTLGRMLGCSRSALYRAAAPLGGVAEMVVRRRLSNVHRLLQDPAEHRSIAAIAQAHGFAQPSQFSRQFRRIFGTTAGAVRASALPADDAATSKQDKGGVDGGPAVQHR